MHVFIYVFIRLKICGLLWYSSIEQDLMDEYGHIYAWFERLMASLKSFYLHWECVLYFKMACHRDIKTTLKAQDHGHSFECHLSCLIIYNHEYDKQMSDVSLWTSSPLHRADTPWEGHERWHWPLIYFHLILTWLVDGILSNPFLEMLLTGGAAEYRDFLWSRCHAVWQWTLIPWLLNQQWSVCEFLAPSSFIPFTSSIQR